MAENRSIRNQLIKSPRQKLPRRDKITGGAEVREVSLKGEE